MSQIEELLYNAEEHGKRYKVFDEVAKHGKRYKVFDEVAKIRVEEPNLTLEQQYQKAYQSVMNT